MPTLHHPDCAAGNDAPIRSEDALAPESRNPRLGLSSIRPPRKLATRLAAIIAAAVVALTLAGCQSVANAGSSAQVRIIDASPDAPALDIVPTSPSALATAALYNVGFGAVSSYIPFAPGAWTHTAYISGTGQQIATLRTPLAPNAQYTLLASDISASLRLTLLRDQSTSAPPGLVSLRFLGESPRTGALDLYLVPPGASLSSGIAPAAVNIVFGSNTGYRNLPAGTYSLVALPAGSPAASATPLFTGIQTIYPAGAARTILVLDRPAFRPASSAAFNYTDTLPGLHLITASDYDPPAS